MSGICGIIRFDGSPVTNKDIQTLLDAMVHYGGDSEDIIVKDNMGFGHKILWTTPESKYEILPLSSDDGYLTIVADARIDNRSELIKKLKLNTHEQTLITDTKLILSAYQFFGEDCVNQIYGDFSFAIWNHQTEQLFCARDRIGIRQFYYYLSDNNILVFSTSIDPIFSFFDIEKKLDEMALRRYIEHFALNRDETFFVDIKRIPSANSMLVSREEISINRYWFPEMIQPDYTMSLEDATSGFKQYFEQAINSCLRSDYPIAFDVSGGLDSSSVFCSALQMNPSANYIPCAMEYDIETCNEQVFINSIEEKYNISIYKINVSQINYSKKDMSFLYQKPQGWPNRGVSIESLVKDETLKKLDARIVLTGVGGDEIIGGDYNYMMDYIKAFKWNKIFQELKCINVPLVKKLRYLITLIFKMLPGKIKNIINRIRRKKPVAKIESKLKLDEITDNLQINTSFIYSDVLSLLSCHTSFFMDMNQMQLAEAKKLEYRHPFFDGRLIEFVLKIPPEHKAHCAKYKNILRKSMENVLPLSILKRSDKAEFSQSILMQMERIRDVKTLLNCTYLVDKRLLSAKKVYSFKSKYKSKSLSQGELVEYWIYINLEKWIGTK